MSELTTNGDATGDAPRAVDRPEGFLETAAAVAGLAWRSLSEAPFTLRHYGAEVVRQAGIITLGGLPVITLILFFAGGTCGVHCSAIGTQASAETLVPAAVVLCTIRVITTLMFGYIVAAKIGCGMVAELGAMRVREEVDALDVMGIRSIAYLVSTRMLAALMTLPVIFVIGGTMTMLAAFLVSAFGYGDISVGTWSFIFFSFLEVADLVKAFATALAMTILVIAVSLYFGYRARGGPVEVGVATARSMGVNVVGVTVISSISTLTLYGTGNQLPVA